MELSANITGHVIRICHISMIDLILNLDGPMGILAIILFYYRITDADIQFVASLVLCRAAHLAFMVKSSPLGDYIRRQYKIEMPIPAVTSVTSVREIN